MEVVDGMFILAKLRSTRLFNFSSSIFLVRKIGVLTAEDILVLCLASCLTSARLSKIKSLLLFRLGSLNGMPTSDKAILISSFFGRDLSRTSGFGLARVPPCFLPKIGP